MDVEHVPVLLEECVRYLEPERGGLFVDCTVGLGGHSARFLEASPAVRLIGIDRDPAALAQARRRLQPFGDRVRLLQGNFFDLDNLLRPLGLDAPRGILADFGLSSLQLDTAERGFSFRFEGPLDMRMGGGELTAAAIVNDYSEADLMGILREYGEEKQARRIARAIVERRSERPFSTTTDLAEVVRGAKGNPRHESRIDPATRTFQALRIEVNRELAGLDRFIDQAVRLLERDNGKLVVISYHSLEDRIAKNTLRALARGEIDQITGRPHAETQLIEVLTKKPLRPSPEEIAVNPRSRSAKLRAARRL